MSKSYDARLATRITAGVDARLRQFALASRRRISHVLDDVLDAALPSSDELAARLRQLASDGHAASDCPAPSAAGTSADDAPAPAPADRAPRGQR